MPSAKEPALFDMVLCAALSVYLALGIYTELTLIATLEPLPQQLLSDFDIYQRALETSRSGGNPYALPGRGWGFLYPPPSLLPIEPFADLASGNARAALYIAANCALLAAIIFGIARRYKYSLDQVWWWFPLGFGFGPFLEAITVGQINVLTLAGLAALLFWENEKPILAGVGLALAISTKVSPLSFLGYLAVTRNWKAITGALTGVLILSLLSIARYGYTPFVVYFSLFRDMLHRFSLDTNSQSLVAKLTYYGLTQDPEFAQRILLIYTLAVLGVSAVCSYLTKRKDLFLIVVGIGTTLAPNIMWYHHYVFLLLPLFVWMACSHLNRYVIGWCVLSLCVIQIDRFVLTYGLLVHVFEHVTMLSVLAWQVSALLRPARAARAALVNGG